MNTNRDLLDETIDAVAARLTHVDDDPAMVSHIVDTLPERATWFGWLFHSWAPRLAMIAIVVAAGMVWGNRREVVIAPIASVRPPITTPTILVASVKEAAPNRTMPLERVERLEPVELSKVDFDRSLPSIATVASLEFDSLAPAPLPASEDLVLESLVIADLPLTPEPVSPR